MTDDLHAAATAVAGNADAAVALLEAMGAVPVPGDGATRERWALLTDLSAADLTAGRVAEVTSTAWRSCTRAVWTPPLPRGRTWRWTNLDWGVFAAEGPGVRVDADDTPDGWRLTGTKPWCSLADRLSHALVTAHTDRSRRLFAMNLRDPAVRVHQDVWVSRGLAEVTSGPIDLDRVVAIPVGADQWYLNRPVLRGAGWASPPAGTGGARARPGDARGNAPQGTGPDRTDAPRGRRRCAAPRRDGARRRRRPG